VPKVQVGNAPCVTLHAVQVVCAEAEGEEAEEEHPRVLKKPAAVWRTMELCTCAVVTMRVLSAINPFPPEGFNKLWCRAHHMHDKAKEEHPVVLKRPAGVGALAASPAFQTHAEHALVMCTTDTGLLKRPPGDDMLAGCPCNPLG